MPALFVSIAVTSLQAGACGHPPAGQPGADGGSTGPDGGAGGAPAPPPPPKLCALSLQCGGMIPDDPKIDCRLDVADGSGAMVYADHAGVELHGRSSLHFPKKSYSLELRDAAGAERPINLFGMGTESDWILDGMWADRSLVRNALAYDVFRGIGGPRYAAEGRYCTLSLDGQPQGIYRLVERIKRDDDRVALAADDGTGKSFILKQDDEGVGRLSIGLQDRWQIVYPKEELATPAQIAGVQRWLDGLGAALASANPADAYTGVFAFLEPEATIDWVLIQELAKNIDAYNLSLYFSRDDGSLARPIPWDFDLSLGQPTVRNEAAGMNEQPSGWIIHRTSFITALQKVPALKTRLGPRWRELRAGPLATAVLIGLLDRYAVTLTPDAIAQNFARWPLGEIDYGRIYPPYSLYPVTSHADETAKLRAFLQARLAWIDANIDAYPN
jgi:hypothetical protein